MEKTHLQRVREKVAEIKKHKFFDPTYDPVFKKIFKNKKNLIHFLNAVLHLEGDSRIKSVKHLMPTVYSIWICNFKVPFCKHFREELALYRTADVGKPHP